MRADDATQSTLFAFIDAESRIPARHPLRAVRTITTQVTGELRDRLDALYRPGGGAAAAAPEQILRALLLWALYGLPSQRRLLDELQYNLLFRWFVGLNLEDRVWIESTFRSHRRRLASTPAAAEFFARVLARLPPRLIASDHFALNHPLIEAWCGQDRIPGIPKPAAVATAKRMTRGQRSH